MKKILFLLMLLVMLPIASSVSAQKRKVTPTLRPLLLANPHLPQVDQVLMTHINVHCVCAMEKTMFKEHLHAQCHYLP